MRLMFPSGYEMINSASIAGSQTIVRHVVYQSFVFSLLWHDCLDSRARFLEQIRIIGRLGSCYARRIPADLTCRGKGHPIRSFVVAAYSQDGEATVSVSSNSLMHTKNICSDLDL